MTPMLVTYGALAFPYVTALVARTWLQPLDAPGYEIVVLTMLGQSPRRSPGRLQPLECGGALGATLEPWGRNGQTLKRSWPESRRRKRASVEAN